MYKSTIRLLVFLAMFVLCLAQANESLKQNFLNPPDSARPWVYWFIMDGNFSREGITADMEAMKSAGIGGVILMEVSVGIPRGPVEFMSEEWRTLFKHAVEEAERLGLEITLNAGPGWTGSGGPWVKAEESMQHLVASTVEVSGATTFDAVLPRPEPRKPYFGEEGLPESMLKARQDFYADVAVLAFPKRTDNTRLEDIDEKALYLRHPYTSVPHVKPFIPAPAAYPALPPEAIIPQKDIVNLTDKLQPDGRLVWDAPKGDWTVLRFGRRTTGTNTRPAPQPGLGFESDKFDPAALEAHFDSFLGPLLQAIGPRPADRTVGWTMLHIDSWEMGAQNWTANFQKEFRDRRGYDPLPYLPTMTGLVVDSVEISERFLWDLRLTAQELVIENHARHLRELGRKHGFGLSIEPYDMNPTSDLLLGGEADVPMCEFWANGFGFDSVFSCIESTSIAHTRGRPIVAAESFTSGSEEAWQLYPGVMKSQGDWALCTGINRIVFHRFAHQPWLDRRPGMTMGPYGVHWDRTQTWWPMAEGYHRYLARCQYLLRQGVTVADICYLAPEGAPHVFRPPSSALEGEARDRRGYNFDGCAPETLLKDAMVKEGRIELPGGASYSLLALPAFDTMTPALMKKIKELVGAGATVVGSAPLKSPSLSNYPECDQEIQRLSNELWGSTERKPQATKRAFGKGFIISGEELIPALSKKQSTEPTEAEKSFPELYPKYEATARLLNDMGTPPDFEADGPIRYTHRRASLTDIYFVANRSDKWTKANCRFRVEGKQPELCDPLTGETKVLNLFKQEGKVTEVPMQFAPHQSFFMLFQAPADSNTNIDSNNQNFTEYTQLVSIEGPWQVLFDSNLGGPGKVQFPTLTDWSQHSEPGIKFYSGIAVYSTVFDFPSSLKLEEKRLFLNLGCVHAMARVKLNGNDLGVVWCAPWQVDITHAVKSGENRLTIEVANLWPNRLIGDSTAPTEKRVAWTTWNPYKPNDSLLPSGLLGPVQIMKEE